MVKKEALKLPSSEPPYLTGGGSWGLQCLEVRKRVGSKERYGGGCASCAGWKRAELFPGHLRVNNERSVYGVEMDASAKLVKTNVAVVGQRETQKSYLGHRGKKEKRGHCFPNRRSVQGGEAAV